jgi:hypothetical protein
MTPIILLGIGFFFGIGATLAVGAILSGVWSEDFLGGINKCSRTEQMKRNCG